MYIPNQQKVTKKGKKLGILVLNKRFKNRTGSKPYCKELQRSVDHLFIKNLNFSPKNLAPPSKIIVIRFKGLLRYGCYVKITDYNTLP